MNVGNGIQKDHSRSSRIPSCHNQYSVQMQSRRLRKNHFIFQLPLHPLLIFLPFRRQQREGITSLKLPVGFEPASTSTLPFQRGSYLFLSSTNTILLASLFKKAFTRSLALDFAIGARIRGSKVSPNINTCLWNFLLYFTN